MDPIFMALGLGQADAPGHSVPSQAGARFLGQPQANAYDPAWAAYVQAASVAAAGAAMNHGQMLMPGAQGSMQAPAYPWAPPQPQQAGSLESMLAGQQYAHRPEASMQWDTSSQATAPAVLGSYHPFQAQSAMQRSAAPQSLMSSHQPTWQCPDVSSPKGALAAVGGSSNVPPRRSSNVPTHASGSLLMPAPMPASLMDNSPTNMAMFGAQEASLSPVSPRDPDSPNGPASPLVLPDVLPAEFASRKSSCCGDADVEPHAPTDADLDAALWPGVAVDSLSPAPWPSSQWQPLDMRDNAMLPVGLQLSACSPGLSLPLVHLGGCSPDPCTPSTAASSRCTGYEKENIPGALNFGEFGTAFPMEKSPKLNLAPLLALELDNGTTPPPKSSILSPEAPCFVPREVFAYSPTSLSVSTEGLTPEKLSLADAGFVAARAHMLELRPKNSPKRQLSEVAVQVAAAAFKSGRTPTPPPPPGPPPQQTAAGGEHAAKGAYLLDLVRGEGKRGNRPGNGKTDSRAQIRASAADARAHYAEAAATLDYAIEQNGKGYGSTAGRSRRGGNKGAAKNM